MQKMIFLKCALLSVLFLLGACESQGVVEADNNELTSGPGLFSGEDGQFSLSGFLFGEDKKKSEKPSNANEPREVKNLGQVGEFEMYKAWRKTKEGNSPDYQDFKYWMEYQEYLRTQQR
ncbi:MAG: hypothetical protein ACRBBR_03550 [Cellvibrionaceae bacterium]